MITLTTCCSEFLFLTQILFSFALLVYFDVFFMHSGTLFTLKTRKNKTTASWLYVPANQWICSLHPCRSKMSSLHHFIPLDICVWYCHNECTNFWVIAKNLFYEVTVTFDHQNLISSSLSPSGRLYQKKSPQAFWRYHENGTYRRKFYIFRLIWWTFRV